jgi:hypothetical protein
MHLGNKHYFLSCKNKVILTFMSEVDKRALIMPQFQLEKIYLCSVELWEALQFESRKCPKYSSPSSFKFRNDLWKK